MRRREHHPSAHPNPHDQPSCATSTTVPAAAPASGIDHAKLRGTTALVTGGSDGLGLIIARELASSGAEVVLPVRNQVKGQRAVDTIRRAVPHARVSTRELDLADLATVRRLGETLRREGRPLHLLVCNAGVMTPPARQETADGFELQFGTNHLGHVALVAELLPLLSEGRARVVTQTSVAARGKHLTWNDLQHRRSYADRRVYGESKLAQGLFALELARRSHALNWGITSVLSHPGVAPTSLLAARPELGRTEDGLDIRIFRALSERGVLVGTPESAALPALMAATAAQGTAEADSEPEATDRSGAARGDTSVPDSMFGPLGPGNLGGPPGRHPLFRSLQDPEAAERLWTLSARLAGVRFPD